MKGSLCTLSKRGEREREGGEKSLLKPHHSFVASCTPLLERSRCTASNAATKDGV